MHLCGARLCGAWMASSLKYFEIHESLSRSAIYKMKSIWNFKKKKKLKKRTFKETIEPILLYGRQCWTIDYIMRNQLMLYQAI